MTLGPIAWMPKVKVLVSQLCLTLFDPMDYAGPWNSLGKNTGVSSYSLLQRLFPTQRSNSGLLHFRQILYHLNHQLLGCLGMLEFALSFADSIYLVLGPCANAPYLSF